MKRIVAVSLLLGAAVQAMAAEPGEFRFRKEILRSDAAKESIVALPFDADVYGGTRAGFPDVRIFDAEGRETPYLIEMATGLRTITSRADCPSRVESLSEMKKTPDGLRIVVILDKDSRPADGLTIVTPLSNFERRVEVLGSRDGKEWKPLVENGLVFDYARYMDVSNREIRLPKNDYRQLQIVVHGVGDVSESPFQELTRKYHGDKETERLEKTVLERRPFRIDRIELWNDKTETLPQVRTMIDYPVEILRIEEDRAKKATVVTVQTHGEPLTEFTLETSSRNFSRTASVQVATVEANETRWNDIDRGQVSLLAFGSFRREALTLSFAEHRQREYRIVVFNEDNPPLQITGVKARGNQYRAIFLAGADQSYRLLYGSAEVEPPRYDAAAVLGSLRLEAGRPTEGSLGQQFANAIERKPTSPHLSINNPLVMGAVIALLTAVLAWALFRATRRINEIPKE
jgi:hypothetical protein